MWEIGNLIWLVYRYIYICIKRIPDLVYSVVPKYIQSMHVFIRCSFLDSTYCLWHVDAMPWRSYEQNWPLRDHYVDHQIEMFPFSTKRIMTTTSNILYKTRVGLQDPLVCVVGMTFLELNTFGIWIPRPTLFQIGLTSPNPRRPLPPPEKV